MYFLEIKTVRVHVCVHVMCIYIYSEGTSCRI